MRFSVVWAWQVGDWVQLEPSVMTEGDIKHLLFSTRKMGFPAVPGWRGVKPEGPPADPLRDGNRGIWGMVS